MLMSPEIREALCEQAQSELDNFQKYVQVASFFESLKLPNLAKKFYDQADEERLHYFKIVQYLNKRLGGKFVPSPTSMTILQDLSLENVAQKVLEFEIDTTLSLESISELMRASNSFIDFAFIDEMLAWQVIEEDEADEFLSQMRLVKDIVLFDKSLG